MKKFFKKAEAVKGEDGFSIMLDGKPVRTPAGKKLAVTQGALAQAIASEWEAQEDTIKPDLLPLTKLVNTGLDRISTGRQATIDELMNYANTDLLCYRVADPPDLAQRQDATWQPILDWVESEFGAGLVVTRGVLPVAQAPDSLASLRRQLDRYDDLRLAGLGGAVPSLGSLVLALALAEGRLSVDEALAASLLDELWQIERWSMDVETEKRHRGLRQDVTAAARVLDLCRPLNA